MLGERRKLNLPVIFLTAAVVVVQIHAQSSCVIRDNKLGICIPVLECEITKYLLTMTSKPLPNLITQAIQSLYCGTFSDVHHVCCPLKNATAELASAPVALSQPIPTRSMGADSIIRPSVAKSDADIQYGLTILNTSKCGQNDAVQPSSGKHANLSEYPWMALLVYDDGLVRTLDCGGSLITERYVLTAAYCIRVTMKRLVSVRLGEHDISEPIDCTGNNILRKCAPSIQEIDIEEAIYHEGYNPRQFADDIGLIRLISRAIFRSNVQPICLPVTPEWQTATTNQMIIAGWNLKNNSTCKGGSGGPIFFSARHLLRKRYVQYAVISGGSFWCGPNFAGISSRISSYLTWIAGNLRS